LDVREPGGKLHASGRTSTRLESDVGTPPLPLQVAETGTSIANETVGKLYSFQGPNAQFRRNFLHPDQSTKKSH
jgi:hypothetical protein